MHSLKVGSTNQISERSHMTTVKPNCVMHWTVAVTPIPLQSQSLDRHFARWFWFEWLCFTSVVEQTLNSCFHQQESPILTAGKIVRVTCTCCDITSVYIGWTRWICQAISLLRTDLKNILRKYALPWDHRVRLGTVYSSHWMAGLWLLWTGLWTGPNVYLVHMVMWIVCIVSRQKICA